jgi:hypothetical protein
MSNTVIKAENTGKSYLVVGHQTKTRENYAALRDVIVNKAKGLWACISNSQGKISIKGRVSSLLEEEIGFHPELTGPFQHTLKNY